MKILSWNVNGIRAVHKKEIFIPWLKESGADVVCIQETKANKERLVKELTNPSCIGLEYTPYFASAKKQGYSGVAIYTRREPDKIELLGNTEFDDEGRTIAAFFKDLAVISAYFPNSQEGGKRLQYKLDFCSAIYEYCNNLVKNNYNIVLCGDYNIAHKSIDIENPKANEKNPGYLPEEREWMDFFTNNGYTDTFRMFCKEPKQYTWWSYRQRAREKNIGWRIDYLCVNNSYRDCVKSSFIQSAVLGSDHCPVGIEVND